MDYVKLVRDIVEPLVSNPEALMIRIVPDDRDDSVTQVLVVAQSEDVARLIGRGGSVAESIREVVNVAGKLSNTRVHVKFESYEENK